MRILKRVTFFLVVSSIANAACVYTDAGQLRMDCDGVVWVRPSLNDNFQIEGNGVPPGGAALRAGAANYTEIFHPRGGAPAGAMSFSPPYQGGYSQADPMAPMGVPGFDHGGNANLQSPGGRPLAVAPQVPQFDLSNPPQLDPRWIPRRDQAQPFDPNGSDEYSRITLQRNFSSTYGSVTFPTQPMPDGRFRTGPGESALCAHTPVAHWLANGIAYCAIVTAGHCLPHYDRAQPVSIVGSLVTGLIPMAFSRHPNFQDNGSVGHDIALGFASGQVCNQIVQTKPVVPMCTNVNEVLQGRHNLGMNSLWQGRRIFARTLSVLARGFVRLVTPDSEMINGGSSGGASTVEINGRECVYGVISQKSLPKTADKKSPSNVALVQSGDSVDWVNAEIAKMKRATGGA